MARAAVPQPTELVDVEGTTEVLLVRHARSADVVPGTPEAADPGLHKVGKRQADALAARLATKPLAAVVSSQLRRAILTAQAIAEPHGLDVGIDPDLQEVLLGDWGGGEFRRRAAARDPAWLAWSATGRWDGIPGAEGDAALRSRVRNAVERVAAAHVGRSVAVVSHGGAINAYLAGVLGIRRSLWLTVANTSITVVRIGPPGSGRRARHHVVVAGDCHHLYDPVLTAG
jgi:probable phosphoglycerate mutase